MILIDVSNVFVVLFAYVFLCKKTKTKKPPEKSFRCVSIPSCLALAVQADCAEVCIVITSCHLPACRNEAA